ncbi:MAG: SidA/IucD/PvdA family monooxygenase [Chitinivibrionales bacterium]|nr:SidA/IucD/PvdA family monooxygenase [Chitinivibrionales bacterium]
MKTDVAIIGAGPYGISIAQELWERKIEFRIFGSPFSLWFSHTQNNMAIRSDRHTSEIYTTQNRYNFIDYLDKHYAPQKATLVKKRIPVTIFRNYLRDILRKLPFEITDNRVEYLAKTNGEFTAQLNCGEQLAARRVIIATGIESHKFLPSCLKKLASRKIIHTWDVQSYENLRGKKVLVIGAGQSAAEAIIQLKAHNEVTWLLRHEPAFFSEPINLPTPVFLALLYISPWFYFLPTPARDRLGRMFVHSTITPDLEEGVMDGAVTKAYGDVEEMNIALKRGRLFSTRLDKKFDCIVAATGYRLSLSSLGFLCDALQSRIRNKKGIPLLSYNFQTNIPNLYMAGGISEPTYGPAQRFIMGTRHAALKIGKSIAAN